MPDRLAPDDVLGPGQSIVSQNGRASLLMQSDGNLVLYQIAGGTQTALWATGTDAPGSRIVMQGDGNLALYTSGGDCHWAAGTHGNPGSWLALQDDGNLVLYSAAGPALWTAGTQLTPEIVAKGDRLLADQVLEPGEALVSPNERAAFVVLRGGGLVLLEWNSHDPSESLPAYWSVPNDAAGSRLAMQADGNLVLYAPDGTPRWAANTEENPGAWLVLQDDGNLVIYAGNGPALWASNTTRTWQ
jgi:hypothetical protein